MTKKDYAKVAYLIEDNFAFFFADKGIDKYLCVVDLNNLEYKAYFYFDKTINRFVEKANSFKRGLRKSKMLYLLEINTKDLYKGLLSKKVTAVEIVK